LAYFTVRSDIPHLDLFRVLAGASDQWFSLGDSLEVPHYKLKNWKRQNNHNSEKSVQELFLWLADNRHLTRDEVAGALCEIGRIEEARKISNLISSYDHVEYSHDYNNLF